MPMQVLAGHIRPRRDARRYREEESPSWTNHPPRTPAMTAHTKICR